MYTTIYVEFSLSNVCMSILPHPRSMVNGTVITHSCIPGFLWFPIWLLSLLPCIPALDWPLLFVHAIYPCELHQSHPQLDFGLSLYLGYLFPPSSQAMRYFFIARTHPDFLLTLLINPALRSTEVPDHDVCTYFYQMLHLVYSVINNP